MFLRHPSRLLQQLPARKKMLSRNMTQNHNSIKISRISKHLSLRKVLHNEDKNISMPTGSFANSSRRTCPNLVLLFEWLFAKPSALDKYCELYHNLGLDVLTVKGSLNQFLWPPFGGKLAKDLMDYLSLERDPKSDQYIIHAFSIGAYNFTMCMMLAIEEPQKYGFFQRNVQGQIFDSIVIGSYDNMSTGIASAFSKSPSKNRSIIKVMDLYYNLTSETTKKTYDKMVATFKEHPFQVPSVFFFSRNDPMCNPIVMEEMEAQWRQDYRDFDVQFISWSKSVHAAHLKYHQEDYLRKWSNLMKKMNLEAGAPVG